MNQRRRTGTLRISREASIGFKLSLADYGLRDRIWLDLRFTPATVRVGKQTFDLEPGQAVISMAGYAAEFGCHRRVIAAGLARLAADGWFRVDSSPRGTVVTCLRDPRDGSDLDVRPKGGGCPPCGQASENAENQPEPPVDRPGCPPCGQAHIDDAVVRPGGSTPNNDPGAAVKSPPSQEPTRARDENVAPAAAAADPFDPSDDPPPRPPGGGRPQGQRPCTPSAAARPPGLPPAGALRGSASSLAAAIGPMRPIGPSPAGPILPRPVASAAAGAGVPLGLAAALALDHRGREAELLGWLLAVPRRRARSAAALVRWALARRISPPLAEFDAAKRALRGLEPLPRGASSASRWFRRSTAALARRMDAAPSYRSDRSDKSDPSELLRAAQERLLALGRPGLAARLAAGLPMRPSHVAQRSA